MAGQLIEAGSHGGALATTAPTPGEAEIAARLESYQRQAKGAFSASTLRAVQSDTAIFADWCARNGAAALPATPETVAAFVDAMSAEPVSTTGAPRAPATVSRYVASINHLHRAAGLAEPGRGNAARLALKRMKRSAGTAQKQAAGLRWKTIQNALAKMGDDLIDLRDAALICVAYDTLARASELVALRVEDFTSDQDGATALIRRSKTDQEGQGSLRFISESTFERVKRWADAAGLEPGDALFRPVATSAARDRLLPGDVSRVWKRRCGGRFTAHSSRVGAAQDAKAAGATSGAIAQAGGWKSDAMVNRYTARLNAQESAAAMLARRQGR